MIWQERERHAHGRMFAYDSYKREIADFEARAMRQSARIRDVGVRGCCKSDPTARGGTMLADPPPKLREKIAWCEAIEDAWAECLTMDEGNARGLAYMMERNFGLRGGPHAKERNAEHRDRICAECGISVSTFYAWLGKITESVIYHAAKRRLI